MNTKKSLSILTWFERLDSWSIPYYLLRPIDLNKDEKDIDLIITKSEVSRLVHQLRDDEIQAKYTTSVAGNSVGILIEGELLLDIKTSVCFLPKKFLSFKKSPPFSGITVTEKNHIYPDVKDEHLFTFWILHFFLDKAHPSQSSSFNLFTEKFANSATEMLYSSYCQDWIQRIFKRKHKAANYVLEQFCKHQFQTTPELTRFTKELILNRDLSTLATYYIEKIKYAIIRRTKKQFYTPIASYNC